MKKMKKGIFIQARLSSSRLPGKMLKCLGGIPLSQYVFNRCKQSSKADIVAIITSMESSDDSLYQYCRTHEIPIFRGDLNNVLNRYIQAGKHFGVDLICRVCGDSPFVDTSFIDKMLHRMEYSRSDYMSFIAPFNGFLSEVVSLETLIRVQKLTNSDSDLEHVTRYIRNNLSIFNHIIIDMEPILENNHNITLTIDYEKDLQFANLIVDRGLVGFDFTSQDVVKHIY